MGLGLGGSSFGSLTVNGTLRMQQNSFAIPNSNADGPEITIGTTGRIVGVSAGAEEVGEPLTGSGQIDNHGAIALPVDGPTVLDHHYAVTFAVPADVTTPDAVTVYAATFESGSRDLPVPTRDGYSFTGWTLGGDPFDATTTLPGTSEDGIAVDVELTATLWDLVWAGEVTNDTFAPLRALRWKRPSGGNGNGARHVRPGRLTSPSRKTARAGCR